MLQDCTEDHSQQPPPSEILTLFRVPQGLLHYRRRQYVSSRRRVDPELWLTAAVMSNDTVLQEQFSDNTLINGRMPYNCSLVTDRTPCCTDRTYSKFRVKPGKTYKLRLINTGAGGFQYFNIDGHNLTVISNDFVQVHPYNTTSVILGVSQFPEA